MSPNEDPSVGTWVLLILGGFVLIGGIGYGVHACTIADKATLGAVEQDVDTNNYRRSEAYREGLQHDFDELAMAYAKATPEEKPAILATIRHRAGGAPPEYVPANIRPVHAGRRGGDLGDASRPERER